MPSYAFQWRLASVLIPCTAVVVLFPALARLFEARRRRRHGTSSLRGPHSPSFLLGYTRELHTAEVEGRAAQLFSGWASVYGSIYWLPHPLGASHLVITDPKALAHVFGHDTAVYAQTDLQRTVVRMLTGVNLMSYEGVDHRRHRRTMAPSFSSAALRSMQSLFEDCAHELKTQWEDILSNREHAIIDVGEWMNRISLDNIGATGFGHSFSATAGVDSRVFSLFSAFNGEHSIGSLVVFLFASTLPALWGLPTRFRKLADEFEQASRELAKGLLNKTREEARLGISNYMSSGRSVLEALIQTQSSSVTDDQLSQENVQAQIQLLLLAAFDTTSTVLTWALISLAQHQDIQRRLREELTNTPSGTPSSYLEAVVHETLRLYPPLPELTRVATQDDIIPLSEPITTVDGDLIDRVHVPQGTVLLLPVEYVNQSTTLWGKDASAFDPERWLEGSAVMERAKNLGYRGMLTFSDGPRICLGKTFAIAEIKTVLSILVQHFSFELANGEETKIGRHRAMVSRPTMMGERGVRMPMIVRSIEP